MFGFAQSLTGKMLWRFLWAGEKNVDQNVDQPMPNHAQYRPNNGQYSALNC
jgi:hypothetical protein